MVLSSPVTVSVIIPCYNQARYLPDALNSLIAQVSGEWECIVVDDGSCDETSQVVAEFSQRCPRIRGVYQENSGSSAARNRGLQEAAGRYIQFLDADDYIAPDKLTKQLAVISSHPELAVSICDYYYTNEQGSVYEHHPCYRSPKLDTRSPQRDIALRWETELSIPIHCFLFDARIFQDGDIRFDRNLVNNEDWDCWMQVFSLNPKVLYVDEKLVFYRLHEGSKTSNPVGMRRGFLLAIEKQRLLFRDDPKLQAVLIKKAKEIKLRYRYCVFPWSVWRVFKRKVKVLLNLQTQSTHSTGLCGPCNVDTYKN